MITAELLSSLLNGAFSAIAMLRRQGVTNHEINERLDRVDNGEQPITVEELQEELDEWQTLLNEAKKIT